MQLPFEMFSRILQDDSDYASAGKGAAPPAASGFRDPCVDREGIRAPLVLRSVRSEITIDNVNALAFPRSFVDPVIVS